MCDAGSDCSSYSAEHEHQHDENTRWVDDAKAGDTQDITEDGGVKKECLVEGQGKHRPPKGAKVQVHYVGTLESDGSQFDSSRDRGEPFEFKLGQGQVIKGWDLGVATMRKGEKSILTCTSDYGYGDTGSGASIPGGATLKFEVELLGWESREDVSKDRDKSIMKSLIKEGSGWDKPEFEAKCVIDIKGPGFDKVDWEIICGDDMVPPGVEQCIEGMKKGEECEVTVQSKHLGDGDWGNLGLDEGEPGTWTITLKSFEKPKSRWSLKGQEKVDEALKRKDEGNALYKAQKLLRAKRKYDKAQEIAGDEYDCSDEQKEELRKIKLPCLTNLAAVELALKEWKSCIEHCGKALEIDKSSVKALLRRAKAYNAIDEWDLCRADIQRIIGDGGLDPANEEAKKELERVQKKIRAQTAKDKACYGNLFSKMAQMEKREKQKAKAEQPAAAEAPRHEEPAAAQEVAEQP
eukprot:TRINITY_DN14079_c0_g1_i1.p2 TRINITY_DN14079_c0_g1~~TRINITY_DN14079_c0_g1_i1.p2  ORF type:complete len:493 (+),score=245.68 TRINITY_DN14079_c0_g1_i1:93-1481(+)